MGAAGVPAGAEPPARAEVVHQSARTRITRLFFSSRTVIWKEPLGPDAGRRLRQEMAMLERLRGVAGVSAYYIVAEIDTDGDVLHVAVRDDGAGGAAFAGGSGLVGLKDRVEALGGRIVLHSPRGAGTSLRADIPLTVTNGGVTGPAERSPAS